MTSFMSVSAVLVIRGCALSGAHPRVLLTTVHNLDVYSFFLLHVSDVCVLCCDVTSINTRWMTHTILHIEILVGS